MEDSEARSVLIEEYKILSDHFIHWDDFFWTKAKFFLGVEGIALLASVDRLLSAARTKIEMWQFSLFLLMVTLNLLLCGVWYLTGRRNRLFLNFRNERAFEIEQHPLFAFNSEPLLRTYRHQENQLKDGKNKRWDPHCWEINIPTMFAFVWLIFLLIGISVLDEQRLYGFLLSVPTLIGGGIGITFAACKGCPPETINRVS
jgi:hypothetical protein